MPTATLDSPTTGHRNSLGYWIDDPTPKESPLLTSAEIQRRAELRAKAEKAAALLADAESKLHSRVEQWDSFQENLRGTTRACAAARGSITHCEHENGECAAVVARLIGASANPTERERLIIAARTIAMNTAAIPILTAAAEELEHRFAGLCAEVRQFATEHHIDRSLWPEEIRD